MLQIVVERSMDSTLLRCSGRLVAGDEVLRLREAVICQAGRRRLQLDFVEVETIDAAGLGLLVSLHKLGYVFGFELQVWNPARRVRALLKLTRLESVLQIQPRDGVKRELSAAALSSDGYLEEPLTRPSPMNDKVFPRIESVSHDRLRGSESEIVRSRWKWFCDG
jgi:anti-anti-sigma factor